MTLLATASSRRFHFGYCSAMFLASALSVFPFLDIPVEPSIRALTTPSPFLWIICSLGLASFLSFAASFRESSPSRQKITLLVPIGLVTLGVMRALAVPGFSRLETYGDAGRLQSYLTESDFDFGRWLLGLAILREAFVGINSLIVQVDAEEYVRVTGSLCMFTWGVWLWKRSEHSIVPWLVWTSPMWILLSLGYDEYYPFIAGLIVAVSWHIVAAKRFFPRTAYILVGILPALYIGALPVALALLCYTWSDEQDSTSRSRGLLTAVVALVVAIEVGGEFTGYTRNLVETMNLGGRFLEKEIDSKAAAFSSRSFLSDPSYAFSVEHAVDIFFWLSCGVGLVVVLATLSLGRVARPSTAKSSTRPAVPRVDFRRISGYLLLGLAIFYLIFMLPLLGPTRDIDLYFISMFVILLFAGSRFDQVIATAENPSLERLRFMQLSAFGFAPATMALVVFGVSR